MCDRQNCHALSCELKKLNFALYDMALYLDTHPTCQEGLCYYKKLLAEKQKVEEAYVNACGAISHESGVQNNCWAWVNNPWPWEIGG